MNLTIVMYHYVRDIAKSRYPKIKGLEIGHFEGQLAYILEHYNVIGGSELIDAIKGDALKSLPPRSLLLTFDDGYLEHFNDVFPILKRNGISGCFFPVGHCVENHRVLDFNKIHFILAAAPNTQGIIDTIFKMLKEHGFRFQAKTEDFYWNTWAVATRLDTKEVIFIKRVLQRGFPEGLRKLIVNLLFEKYVTTDEESFSRDLYMSSDQLRCMRENGMHIGSHGFTHAWLDSIDAEAQKNDIDLENNFLAKIGVPLDRWMMCYPYGAYNASLLTTIKKSGCVVGLTTRVGVANLKFDNPLILPRLDTIDLPIHKDAPINNWTVKSQNA